jgi:transcriptional regulator with XRE-family HTH domain
MPDNADELYISIGARIRAAREARGLNQTELGGRLGLNRTSVSNIEAGRQRPMLHTLIAAAQALGVELSALLEGPLPELAAPIEHPADVPRRFYLRRRVDVTGASGTGVVAHGVMWPDGTASVRWATERKSIVFWDGGFEDAEAVHGHAGATQLVFIDGEVDEFADILGGQGNDESGTYVLSTRRPGIVSGQP